MSENNYYKVNNYFTSGFSNFMYEFTMYLEKLFLDGVPHKMDYGKCVKRYYDDLITRDFKALEGFKIIYSDAHEQFTDYAEYYYKTKAAESNYTRVNVVGFEDINDSIKKDK